MKYTTRFGQGSGADHSIVKVTADMRRLTTHEICTLMNDGIMRRAVECMVTDAVMAWRVYSDDDKDEAYRLEKKYNVTDCFDRALKAARVFGGAYILPIPEDKQFLNVADWRRVKIKGFRVLPLTDVSNYDFGLGDTVRVLIDNEYHEVRKSLMYEVKGRIDYLNLDAPGISEVQLFYQHYVSLMSGVGVTDHLIGRSVIDIRGRRGLGEELRNAVDNPAFSDHINSIRRGLEESANESGVFHGIVYDLEKEKVERLSIAGGLGSLAGFHEFKLKLFVSATGLPESKLTGQPVKGLGNDGKGDLRLYYADVEALRTLTGYDLLNWIDGIVAMSEGLNSWYPWEFGALNQETSVEKLAADKTRAEIDAIYAGLFGTEALYRIWDRLSATDEYSATYGVDDASDGGGGLLSLSAADDYVKRFIAARSAGGGDGCA